MAKHHHLTTTADVVDYVGGMKQQSATPMNLVPLPYSRVAVQHVDFVLNEAALKSFLLGKEAWFETDYVIFRQGNDCAVVELRKENREDMFCGIAEVGIVSLPDTSHWIEDYTVDTGNPAHRFGGRTQFPDRCSRLDGGADGFNWRDANFVHF